MANSSGGDVVIPISPRAQDPSGGGQRGHRQNAAWLPLDIIIAEIAVRSDPTTLVRCAATCRAARRRVAEDSYLRGRLRLRDTGRFVLPLLRGHLAGTTTYDYVGGGGRVRTYVYLVDTTTAADATRLVEATFVSAAAKAKALTNPVPMDSRYGLILMGATATAPPLPQHQKLLVCNPATGRRLVLPPEPEPFPDGGCNREQYVLLVGDKDDGEGGAGGAGAGAGAAVGRPFQVIKVKLLLSKHNPSYHRLLVQIFSSEDSSWSPRMEIPTPNIHWRRVCSVSLQKVLVIGDVVHWLCLTEVKSYVLMLHVRDARVSETALPGTFPRYNIPGIRSYLLATDSAGGSPVVLVADAENNIRAWEQCKDTKSKMWKAWPHVVIDREAILGFNDEVKEIVLAKRRTPGSKRDLELLWFGERSGVVLLRTHGYCLLWLDLHSKKIIRCFCSDHWMSFVQVNYPYEMDISSWAPTFSSAVTI